MPRRRREAEVPGGERIEGGLLRVMRTSNFALG
jgi:hypothetical protein